MQDQTSLIIIVVSIAALMLLMSSFILVFIFKYKQRQIQFELEKQQIKLEKEKELAQVELEISEDILKNVSHEIHDNIGHALSLAKLTLHGLDFSNFEEKSKSTLGILTESIADLRNLSKSMNGSYIREIGLYGAIEREVELLNASGAIVCHFNDLEYPRNVGINNEIILFRCVQEAINNCIKHAKATELTISCSVSKNQLKIEVTDNGKGFETGTFSSTGLGLRSMTDRMRMMNGKIEFQSVPNVRTTITFEIPIVVDSK